MLDLDALLLGSYLEEAAEWAAGIAQTAPRTILDVGAGTGAGTVALARRFRNASVTALDRSAAMLAATRAAAAAEGFTDRVHTLEADLDGPWPESATADLMWASSSLHEVSSPERTIGGMYAALNPGGLLVVLEMDSLPSFLPADGTDSHTAELGLESRLHAAMAHQGWNAHPDWRGELERAGFHRVEQRSFNTMGRPLPEPTARYAANFLGRIRTALAGDGAPATHDTSPGAALRAQDLAALDALLSGTGPSSLLHRTDLQVRGRRTAWAAFKA